MRYRQVHLDFHTSEKIEGVGKDFSKEQFKKMLKLGHVDSVTVFSKCHHGWAYHPCTTNEMHPHLDFDLLGAQIEAAHEIGVRTPVYISAGLDEKIARRHPDWTVRNSDETMTWARDFSEPGYHKLCFNSPYLNYLLAQIGEVCANYDADGIFLDIVGVQPCYCQNCIKLLIDAGKDPYDKKNIDELAEKTYAMYCRRVRETIDAVKPGLPVFHNGGHIIRGRRDLADFNTHIELESLPTGEWGYDNFPLSAAYVRNLGKEYMGMTGKFHTAWGEFGGYKHPNALRYEAALAAALGAKCSIGDQLHPYGKMDENTYGIIGKAYSELERKEEWLIGAKACADIAVLSYEAFTGGEGRDADSECELSDNGAVRILLEGHYLFDFIDLKEDFRRYKVLILPDGIYTDKTLENKLKDFVGAGGKVLASGCSALDGEERRFVLDFGAEFEGESSFRPNYFSPKFDIAEYSPAAHVIYAKGYKVKPCGGEVLGECMQPFFNREVMHFSSHMHAPVSEKIEGAGMVEGADGIYIPWNVFDSYAKIGSLILKRMVQYALDRLLDNKKTVETNLPAQGIMTLCEQDNRLILHALYAAPVKRGETVTVGGRAEVSVIEDLPLIYDTEVCIKTDRKVKNVYLAPSREKTAFKQENGKVYFKIDKFECHAMVILELQA